MALVRRPPQKAPEALEQYKQPRDQEGLLAQLHDPAPQARRWAAQELVAYPETALQLCACLPHERYLAVREALLTTLILIKSAAAISGLIPLLRSEDAALRNAVVEALQQMPEVVGPRIAELLTDAGPDVRIFVIDVLQTLQHPYAAHWLATVIASDPHVNVCAAAVQGLAEIGTPEMIPALRALTSRFPHEPFMAFAVSTAISQIAGTQMVERDD